MRLGVNPMPGVAGRACCIVAPFLLPFPHMRRRSPRADSTPLKSLPTPLLARNGLAERRQRWRQNPVGAPPLVAEASTG